MKTGSMTQGTSFTKEMAPVMWYSTFTFRTYRGVYSCNKWVGQKSVGGRRGMGADETHPHMCV